MPQPATYLEELGRAALAALLDQTPLQLRHPAGWTRPAGWPVPIKRNKHPDSDGTTAQPYRPMAVLEFINDELSGANRARAASDRARASSQQEPTQEPA